MAKRKLDPQEAANLFGRTEQKKKTGKVTPKAIGITDIEYDAIKNIADELGVSPHAVMLYAVRDFMKRWEAGERPKTTTKTVLEF